MGTPGSISFSLGGGGKSSARKPGGSGVGFKLGNAPQKAVPIADIFGGAEASDDEEQLGKQDQSNKRQRLNSSGCLYSLDAFKTMKATIAALLRRQQAYILMQGPLPACCKVARLANQQGCKWQAKPLLSPWMLHSYIITCLLSDSCFLIMIGIC